MLKYDTHEYFWKRIKCNKVLVSYIIETEQADMKIDACEILRLGI